MADEVTLIIAHLALLDCSKINGKFGRQLLCIERSCVADLTSTIDNGACCNNKQCTDVPKANSANCSVYLPGVSCMEVVQSKDSCLQGTCFAGLEITCPDQKTCLNGDCIDVSQLKLDQPILLSSSQYSIFSFQSLLNTESIQKPAGEQQLPNSAVLQVSLEQVPLTVHLPSQLD